jgi:hypothetical protein
VLEPVRAGAAAGEAGGVDHAVIGQCRRGQPVLVRGGGERCYHGPAGDAGVGGGVQQVPGVVIEPGDDLHVGAVREPEVGEVGLPGLVGLGGFEPDNRGAWPFLRLRDHQALVAEDAPDRGRGRRGDPGAFESGGDGLRAGIQASVRELVTELHDPGFHRGWHGGR